MTLVVGRTSKGKLAIAADTRLTDAGGKPLPNIASVVKSVLVPGGLCISFSGSPELAARDIWNFTKQYPASRDFVPTVKYFEGCGGKSGVDYLLAFSTGAKLIKISEGCRQSSISPTQWLGDKRAYESFRETEALNRTNYYRDKATDATLMANGIDENDASNIYGTLRDVALSKVSPNVGGLVSLVLSRVVMGSIFRHSATCFTTGPTQKTATQN